MIRVLLPSYFVVVGTLSVYSLDETLSVLHLSEDGYLNTTNLTTVCQVVVPVRVELTGRS